MANQHKFSPISLSKQQNLSLWFFDFNKVKNGFMFLGQRSLTEICWLTNKWRWALNEKLWIGHKWYFVTKIVLTYCEKKKFYWSRKTFEIWGWRPRICKTFEITKTIYSNSERSVQFLKQNAFLTCSWYTRTIQGMR